MIVVTTYHRLSNVKREKLVIDLYYNQSKNVFLSHFLYTCSYDQDGKKLINENSRIPLHAGTENSFIGMTAISFTALNVSTVDISKYLQVQE
jgi:hypothetical protein